MGYGEVENWGDWEALLHEDMTLRIREVLGGIH